MADRPPGREIDLHMLRADVTIRTIQGCCTSSVASPDRCLEVLRQEDTILFRQAHAVPTLKGEVLGALVSLSLPRYLRRSLGVDERGPWPSEWPVEWFLTVWHEATLEIRCSS